MSRLVWLLAIMFVFTYSASVWTARLAMRSVDARISLLSDSEVGSVRGGFEQSCFVDGTMGCPDLWTDCNGSACNDAVEPIPTCNLEDENRPLFWPMRYSDADSVEGALGRCKKEDLQPVYCFQKFYCNVHCELVEDFIEYWVCVDTEFEGAYVGHVQPTAPGGKLCPDECPTQWANLSPEANTIARLNGLSANQDAL